MGNRFTLVRYHSLTHSMVQSPSWAANWYAASQEIPHISRNPNVHYRTHKRPPPFSILGQSNPVYTPTSHLLKIHPNIIHPSMPRSPQWSLSLRFPHQDPIHSLLFTHTRHMLVRYTAGKRTLHFSKVSRQTLGYPQTPVQWAQKALSPEVNRLWCEAKHLYYLILRLIPYATVHPLLYMSSWCAQGRC